MVAACVFRAGRRQAMSPRRIHRKTDEMDTIFKPGHDIVEIVADIDNA